MLPSVAHSKPCKFLIGTDKKEFTIHSALVAKQSKALQVLVNGPFKESTDSSVVWADVEEDTFVSFWEFIYTEDYNIPKLFFTALEDLSNTAEKPIAEEVCLGKQCRGHSVLQLLYLSERERAC